MQFVPSGFHSNVDAKALSPNSWRWSERASFKKTGFTCESLTADDEGWKTKTKKTSNFGFTFISHDFLSEKIGWNPKSCNPLPCRRSARWMYTRPVTWSWSSAGWPDWLITSCFWRFPELILGKRTDEKKSNHLNLIRAILLESYFLEAVFLRWKPLVCGPLHGRGSVCVKKEGEVLST